MRVMLHTFGSDLTSLINSDPAWKVSKGSRSSSRRARKTASKSLNNSADHLCSSSEDLNMPVSGFEKRGVSTLGCHLKDKAENVPIKKRRFLLRSPSPPPAVNALPAKESSELMKIPDVSHKLAAAKSASSDVNFSQTVKNHISISVAKSDNSNGRLGEDEGFCGISILAAAACSSSLERECGSAEDGGVEESSAIERAPGVSNDAEPGSSSKGEVKGDLLDSSEMSTGGISSFIPAELVENHASVSTAASFQEKGGADEKGTKVASFGADSLTLSGNSSCNKDVELGGSQRLSSRDDRLHWDLNVVMDAWEEPLDSAGAQNAVQHNISQDAWKNNPDDKTESDKHDSRDELPTAYAVPGKPKALTNQASGGKENGESDVWGEHAGLGDKSLSYNSNFKLDGAKCSAEDTVCKSRDTVNTFNVIVMTTSDHVTQSLGSAAVNEADGTSVKGLRFIGDEHPTDQPILQDFNSKIGVSDHVTQSISAAVNDAHDTSVKSLSFTGDEHPIDQPVLQDFNSKIGVSSSKLENLKTVCGTHATCDTVAVDTSFSFYGPSRSDKLREVMPTKLNSHNVQVTSSDGEGIPHSSVCTEVPNVTSTTCELLVALDTKLQDVGDNQGGISVPNSENMVNLSEQPPVASRKSCDSHFDENPKANFYKRLVHSNRTDNEESDAHNNVGNRCNPVSAVGLDGALERQGDHDSQYEDGELRESKVRAWEEFEAFDREAEHVDYGSDIIETSMANPPDYQDTKSEQVEDRMNGSPGVAANVSSAGCIVDNGMDGIAVKAIAGDRGHDEDKKIESSHSAEEKIHVSTAKEQLEGTKSSSVTATVVVDDDRMVTHGDGLGDSKDAETRVEEKPFRRGLQSRIGVAHDGSYREQRLNRMENRFESGSFRSFERGRYFFHNQARGRQGDNWDGSSDNRRGCKRHYSPIFPRRSKPDDATVERDDIRCGGTQDGGSFTHLLHQNSRPEADEEPCASFQQRYRPDRKFSPDRATGYSRVRSFRYLVHSRAGRESYNGLSPGESFESSLKYRRPLSRRERSLSPFAGRGQSNVQHSRGNSPSRSRSRSPVMWHFPRGRPGAGRGSTNFIRHRSKSPDFRMQRLRSPNQQPSFGADHAMEFRSIPRTHSSPPRNRWNCGRKDELGHFREFGYKQRTTALGSSPASVHLRGDRDTVLDSPRNLKPDGYCRISDGGVGRGHRYQDNYEDRRKPYNSFCSARRSFEDGMASRIHQDINDSFSVANNIRDRDRDASGFRGRGEYRGIDSRIGDQPRRFRGEHSFICD